MRKLFVYLATVFALWLTSCEKPTKILIIGDSISLGYTPFVAESMEKENCIVTHNPGNGEDSKYGLSNVEAWITADDYDVIQFNWGLWDLCYRNPESKVQGHRDKVNGKLTATPEEYGSNLRAIIELMKEKSDAQLIFVSTTYVPTEEAGRFEKDALFYNKVAEQIMNEYDIPINDIYDESKQVHATHGLGNDNVHYTDKGYEELGLVIKSFLTKTIKATDGQ